MLIVMNVAFTVNHANLSAVDNCMMHVFFFFALIESPTNKWGWRSIFSNLHFKKGMQPPP